MPEKVLIFLEKTSFFKPISCLVFLPFLSHFCYNKIRKNRQEKGMTQEEMQAAMDEYLSTKSDSSAADDTEEAADDAASEEDAE